jgi:hypothetical protein
VGGGGIACHAGKKKKKKRTPSLSGIATQHLQNVFVVLLPLHGEHLGRLHFRIAHLLAKLEAYVGIRELDTLIGGRTKLHRYRSRDRRGSENASVSEFGCRCVRETTRVSTCARLCESEFQWVSE